MANGQQFDVNGARQAGYSDDEILQHLTQSRKFDVQGALSSGYSRGDIINYLAGTPAAPASAAPPQPAITIDPVQAANQALAGTGITVSGQEFNPRRPALAQSPALSGVSLVEAAKPSDGIPPPTPSPSPSSQPPAPGFISGFTGRAGNIIRGQWQGYTTPAMNYDQIPPGQGLQTFNPFRPVETAGYLVPQPVKDLYARIQRGDYSGAAGAATADILSQGPAFLQAIGKVPVPGPAVVNRAANLAAAAEAGGKAPGVAQTYENLTEPQTQSAAQEFANTAARMRVTAKNFEGRQGPVDSLRVANRMQQDIQAQAQPYLDQVNDRPLHWSQVPNPAGGTMTLGDSVSNQIAPLRDALPPKLVDAIDNARTVGDLNDIRMQLNKGGGRYFNAATDTQFNAPESQQAMAQAGNIMRDAVYDEVQRVVGPGAGVEVRRLKSLEGTAINLRTQFEKGARNLSSVANVQEAPPTYWQRIKAGETPTEMGKAAIGLEPPTALDIFNTRMKRAIQGGNPAPIQIQSFPSRSAPPVPPPGARPVAPPAALPSGLGGMEAPTVAGYQTGVQAGPPLTPPGYQLGSAPPPGRPVFSQMPDVGQPYGLRIEPPQLQRGPIITPPPTGVRPQALPPGRTPLALPGTPSPVYVEPTPVPISRLLTRRGVPATRR